MAKRQTWYDKGYADGCEGFSDPPYQPGNRHYDEYVAGNRDGADYLENLRSRGDYYGTQPEPDDD